MGRSQASKKPPARVERGRPGPPQPAPATGRLAFLYQPWLGLVARLIIGLVFVVSAGGKLTNQDAFVRAVASYEILPESLLSLFGAAFPWLELVVGVLLVLGLFTRLAAVAAAGLMVVFIALMVTALAQGKSIDCGCFVGIIQETVGPTTLVRDTVLLLVIVPVLLAPVHRLSLDWRLRSSRTSFSRNATLATGALALSALVGAVIIALFPGQQAQAVGTGGWRLGPETAKVQMVVFSDFQCPGCRQVAPTLKRLVDESGGQVSLVFKHFPLPQHDAAVADAMAAEAAGEQGRFWEMHDAIFAVGGEMTPAQLRAQAGRMGLDLSRYDQAISSGRARQRVEADLNEGMRVGVDYTPYITVNGQVVSGFSYQLLKAAVDRELNR